MNNSLIVITIGIMTAFIVLFVDATNKANTETIIESQNKIIRKQDSILKVNQAFRTYHLDHCAFKEIER